MSCVFRLRTGITEHHRSDSAAVQGLLRSVADERSDVFFCGPLAAGSRCRLAEMARGVRGRGTERRGRIDAGSWLVSWCFETSQPERITSGLKMIGVVATPMKSSQMIGQKKTKTKKECYCREQNLHDLNTASSLQ